MKRIFLPYPTQSQHVSSLIQMR